METSSIKKFIVIIYSERIFFPLTYLILQQKRKASIKEVTIFKEENKKF